MVMVAESVRTPKGFLALTQLESLALAMVMRVVLAFVWHRGRMSCSAAAAGSIASETVHRGELTRFLARPRWQKIDFNAPLRKALLAKEAKRGRFIFIVDATLVSQAGAKIQNTHSTGNRQRRPKQGRLYNAKKVVRMKCHTFTFGLLITPSGIRIPFQIPHDTKEDCRQQGLTHRTMAKSAAELICGRPLTRFVTFIRTDVLVSLTDEEREFFAAKIASPGRSESAPNTTVAARPVVKQWSLDELAPTLEGVGCGRNFERGRAMFAAAQCSRCHRFGDEGLAIGPDLAGASARFNRKDMLESLLDPSKVVEEKYRDTMLKLDDGRVVIGRLAGGNADTLAIASDPNEPTKLVRVAWKTIVTRKSSPVSMMPKGLLDTLSRDETLDLFAYLESAGRAEHENFAK